MTIKVHSWTNTFMELENDERKNRRKERNSLKQ